MLPDETSAYCSQCRHLHSASGVNMELISLSSVTLMKCKLMDPLTQNKARSMSFHITHKHRDVALHIF